MFAETKNDNDTGESRQEENGDSLTGVKLRCAENEKKENKRLAAAAAAAAASHSSRLPEPAAGHRVPVPLLSPLRGL